MPLTLDELVALPYGDEAARDELTPAQILELDYTVTPFAVGMQAADFRARAREHGRRLKWLKAIVGTLGPNGEQPNAAGKFFVDALLSDEIKGFLYQSREEVQMEGFGEIKRGQWMVSFMPDEIFPVRDDRFWSPDLQLPFEVVLPHSDETTWDLGHKRVIKIDGAYRHGEKVLQSRYSLDHDALLWRGGVPAGGVTIRGRYYPTFEYLADGVKYGPNGSDGLDLPVSAPLKLLTEGEE